MSVADMVNKTAAIKRLWNSVQGTWHLKRTLHSANAAEPSGNCIGTATFTPQKPSIFVDEQGKLQNASEQMLYSESGQFEMLNAVGSAGKTTGFTFSKKYIWRMQEDEISVWFIKPGSETVDYLFHKFCVQSVEEESNADDNVVHVECSGGHLCIEDYYSSFYNFRLEGQNKIEQHDLKSWKMLHELPEPFASIPRHALTFGPSPIQYLPRITKELGGNVQIYAKRDDANSGIAYGGNKTRKLEYLVPDALEQGCDTLISIGGYQSNHTRQVAGVAAACGLKCRLVQENWVPDHSSVDEGLYEKVGNIQLSRLMGADVRIDKDTTFGIGHKDTLARAQQEVTESGGKPYYIPAGASDHPLGGLGFARWAFEVRQQEQALGIFFDKIIVCAVTGSTFAGMVAGFKLMEEQGLSPKRKVIGIDASAKPAETRAQVLRIAKFTGAKVGLSEKDITDDDIILDERYHGGIYGVGDERTNEAIRWGARTEGFITDPVYEGKSLAGMMDMVRNGDIESGSKVLYAHLGGQLALNAYEDLQ
ncbi:hypothetical protein LTR05_006574 [Lithohypha guttulata]|uniref:1-aminocyclopropane-1-carboxylate deaminase n=1 Tax=Lithohypha guttulata TaxID=1690604 RepID=A0AAN7SVF8_9EURO|nr:hypothetical protein LTR05_006574 [Lithohypha guttulata]